MRETLRGYADARLGSAVASGAIARVREDLVTFAELVATDEVLRPVLTDPAVPVAARRSIVEDLLGTRADTVTTRVAIYAVSTEKAPELPSAIDWLAVRARDAAGPDGLQVVPEGSRAASRERLEGFAAATFEDIAAESTVEEVEDELFRFARIVEGDNLLRSTLGSADIPGVVREGIVRDLLSGRAQAATVALATYASRAGRPRDVVDNLDLLVERAASERNLRVAEVRSAVELDQTQRDRLAAALARLTGRQVELRLVVDPSLIGGIMALVGDTIIDGSVSHRLEQLRTGLTAPASADPQQGEHSA